MNGELFEVEEIVGHFSPAKIKRGKKIPL